VADQGERFPLITGEAEAIANFGFVPQGVDLGELRGQLGKIVDGLGALFTRPLGLPLKTLEVDLTISAEGSVSFLGTGGKASGEGSIKLTFEKPAS
jgi:hypothetical protein